MTYAKETMARQAKEKRRLLVHWVAHQPVKQEQGNKARRKIGGNE
jgi:hypothetical protein